MVGQILLFSSILKYQNFLKQDLPVYTGKTTMQGWFPKNQQWKLSSYGSLMFKKPIKVSKPKFYQRACLPVCVRLRDLFSYSAPGCSFSVCLLISPKQDLRIKIRKRIKHKL